MGEAFVSSISTLLNLPVFFIAVKFVTACGRQQHAEILSAFLDLSPSGWPLTLVDLSSFKCLGFIPENETQESFELQGWPR